MDCPFLRELSADWPPAKWGELRSLIAVSGGADSMALAAGMIHACQQAGLNPAQRLTIAHFDHRLREDSAADAAFVAEMALGWGLPFVLGVADASPTQHFAGQGPEGAARTARYAFLTQAAEEHGARYLLTGHTRDDQIETVLFNLLRGTGLAGLAGMPRFRPLSPAVTLVRPCLEIERQTVRDFVQRQGIPFREDPTNAALDFTRNRIRQELLPLLRRDYFPSVDQSLWRLAQIAAESHDLTTQAALALAETAAQPFSATSSTDGGVRIRLAPLRAAPAPIAVELLRHVWRTQHWPERDMTFEKWRELLHLASPATFPGGVRVLLQGDFLVLYTEERAA